MQNVNSMRTITCPSNISKMSPAKTSFLELRSTTELVKKRITGNNFFFHELRRKFHIYFLRQNYIIQTACTFSNNSGHFLILKFNSTLIFSGLETINEGIQPAKVSLTQKHSSFILQLHKVRHASVVSEPILSPPFLYLNTSSLWHAVKGITFQACCYY